MTSKSNNDISPIIERARELSEKGCVEEIGDLLESALEENPHSTELMAHLGFYYFKRGRFTRALVIFLKRNQFERPNMDICEMIADIYANHRDYERERLWLKQSVERGNQKNFRRRFRKNTTRKILSSIKKTVSSSRFFATLRKGFYIAQELISFRLVGLFDSGMEGLFHNFLRFAREYDTLYRNDGLAYHKTREIVLASQHLPTTDPHSVLLDIGTGLNTAPVFWSQNGARTIALDGSVYGFLHLKSVSNKAGLPSNQFCCMAGDATLLPFSDNSIDGISALCMLEHIPKDGDIACIKEIHRVLRPGGVAVVTVESNHYDSDGWLEVPYAIGFQSGEDVERKTKIEFREVYCRNYSPDSLKKRLADTVEWSDASSYFYDDSILPIRRWLSPSHPIAPWLRALQPILSFLFYRQTATHHRLTPSSIGCLVLRKGL